MAHGQHRHRTQAKKQLNHLLAEVERPGASVTITRHGRPVARLVPVQPTPRTFGQLPNLFVPNDFDEPLSESEVTNWDAAEER
ncbi:type II toxin-antitoxin system Phd/YefM family antitoxin [Mycolicibacterium diernhoferi]|uniref:Antitoxin n=1 Tax=Mycolicibacterium diernhoferi TaxID=1801 RepID=A0A1Q4H7I9_9MYCO|nr:type II toxin-antitoxin system Phd/YefM family antitoxin [Mycolicibacterium diernhoferi]OJZ63519.1 prevent-host-death protein [Mycolicibacterium diernhoferi]OPE45296.1 prevent-host-death protein [Mycolicibacterium diernhoferi]PEG51760.1 type II toxin-antitoxin system Phd/YefM family antitoxin [Mycolicibacterium diernhoferi]QYL24450.1 type II toxin-antitoxin system Phd/YefM family antitoxin [Mycolicibacterium diernhoferi]